MRISKIEFIVDQQDYYDITVEDTHNFLLEDGTIVHNCGTGVGFSVERMYTDKLPVIAEHFEKTNTTIIIGDSKSGWARAFKELLALLYSGQIPGLDYSKVRLEGERLKTFGGRASGPEPLKRLFEYCIEVFKGAAGRRLRPLEVHDICCKTAEVIVAGGVRRSALISLSDLNDREMATCKNGQWWTTHPHRALANNSAVYNEKPTVGQFLDEWKSLYESKSGERGIFNRQASNNQALRSGRRDIDGVHFGTNPCSEIILRPYQFCNLTEVVVRAEDTLETMKQKVELATILGTIQSTFTDFKYLRKIWKDNCEEERLLGVSMTGIFDNPKVIGWMKELKEHAVKVNSEWAKKLGINQSVAITCVKPSGCTTLETKIRTTSGIMSMAAIFADLADDVDIFELEPGTWLKPNKEMFVFDENNNIQQITKLFINGMSDVYEIEDENGETYKFTGNHKLKTLTGWKFVSELTEKDVIESF